MDEPYHRETTNLGWCRDFTCPGCYAQLAYREWAEKKGYCPICGCKIRCTRKTVPASVTQRVNGE